LRETKDSEKKTKGKNAPKKEYIPPGQPEKKRGGITVWNVKGKART